MIAFEMGPKFSLGRICITPNAASQVPAEDVQKALQRHVRGDWGDIGPGAFGTCWSLARITIPDTVTGIGSGAFSGCTSLNGVTIRKRVTSIGNGTFSGCTGLISITIPDNVTG